MVKHKTILFLFCIANQLHAFNWPFFSKSISNLSFYGFQIGESKTTSLKNIESRSLFFINAAENANNIYQRRRAFIATEHPNRCEEEVVSGLNVITCSISQGDEKTITLVYLNSTLVRSVIEFRSNQLTDNLLKKLRDKVGKELVQFPREGIDKLNASPKNGITNFLANPFGYTTTCNQDCSLHYFPQATTDDFAFLLQDKSNLCLSFFNTSLSNQLVEKEAQAVSPQTEIEKTNSEF